MAGAVGVRVAGAVGVRVAEAMGVRLSRTAAVLGCLTVALAGCGPELGGAARPSTAAHHRAAPTTTAAAAAVARADRTHEYPTPVPRQAVIGGWRSPAQAVAVFADAYINWTAATVSARLRALAEVSVGQARSAMLLAASGTARDYELRRGAVVNRGTVEAVAPLPSAPGQYVVVTREQTTSAIAGGGGGLAPGWHVTLAGVARVGGGLWVLSRWQPES
jgi:hypothetical protein